MAADMAGLRVLTTKSQIIPDGVEAGFLPVTAAMINAWNNRLSQHRARIKQIVEAWV